MEKKVMYLLFAFLCISSSSCSQDKERSNNDDISGLEKAEVVSVSVSGEATNYNFSVGISSPDEGCNQYANWWEVITEDGVLLYRRILAHSHVDEQPFVRSGGVVPIDSNQVVFIRAHMNTSGYGTIVYKGSVSNGFTQDTLDSNFASGLANQDPQPTNCAF